MERPSIGGFFGVGTSRRLIQGLVSAGRNNLTLIANDTSFPGIAIGKLIANLVVTELAVIELAPEGLVLKERAPGVLVAPILAATGARLLVPESVPEMELA
ncbi:MAG: hypothetical protein ACLP7Q_13890 [Isosphaeraceae bacterium]